MNCCWTLLVGILFLPLCSIADDLGAATESPLFPRPGLQLQSYWQSSPLQDASESPDPQSVTSAHASSGWGVADGQRSLAWGVVLSALVPGLGEHYAGHRQRSLLFGLAEAGIWGSYTTFKLQEDLRGRRALEFAVAAAGASSNGDDDYYAAVGQFIRSDGPGMWNEFVRRRLRDRGESMGPEYFDDFAWAWPSPDQFESYRLLRRRELNAGDDARNMLFVALLNRIASVLDVTLAMRADQRAAASEVSMITDPDPFGLRLQLGRSVYDPLASIAWRTRF